MAAVTHLDTHVVVWILSGEHDRLSKDARKAIESHTLEVSPMVGVELAFLREVGKVDLDPDAALRELGRSIEAREAIHHFGAVTKAARRLEWTRDPFDRMIGGHAVAAGARLCTRDETIRAHFPRAIW